MQINTNNKVQGSVAYDQFPFHFTKLYENRQNQFFKQITLTNCRQGNHIPESRKTQLSKSLDILESQWKNYKIKQDYLASKKVLYNIVKQNQSEFNTVKKQPIFRQKFQIQHKRAISNMNFDFTENNKNSKKLSNSGMISQNIHTNTNSEQKSAKKWDKSRSYMSPSIQKNSNINSSSSYMKLMAQQMQRQTQKCETDRFRLSLQNKNTNKPSKSSISINLLVKQFKELSNKSQDYHTSQHKSEENHSKQNKIISVQKPKLKITLNQKKIQDKNFRKHQSVNDYLGEMSTQIPQIQKQKQKSKQKEENKCKLKLSRKKLPQKNNHLEIKKQSKPHQYWTKKCQIKATVRPYQNHVKQQIEKDSKKSSLQQKKFGAISKCNSKTLKITHVTKVNQKKLDQRKNNSLQQSIQKRQKKSSIVSVIQSQAQIKQKIKNSQQKSKQNNSTAVGYMQIQDIIRMSYNNNPSNNSNNKNSNNFNNSNGNYFSLTTRS